MSLLSLVIVVNTYIRDGFKMDFDLLLGVKEGIGCLLLGLSKLIYLAATGYLCALLVFTLMSLS